MTLKKNEKKMKKAIDNADIDDIMKAHNKFITVFLGE